MPPPHRVYVRGGTAQCNNVRISREDFFNNTGPILRQSTICVQKCNQTSNRFNPAALPCACQTFAILSHDSYEGKLACDVSGTVSTGVVDNNYLDEFVQAIAIHRLKAGTNMPLLIVCGDYKTRGRNHRATRIMKAAIPTTRKIKEATISSQPLTAALTLFVLVATLNHKASSTVFWETLSDA
jgi:hypothetical protein